MQYTVYHLYKKAHNTHSPSLQILFPTHVACCNWPRAVAFVDSFNVNFLKFFQFFNFIQNLVYCVDFFYV